MGNFFSQLIQRKGDDRVTLHEFKKLVEGRSTANGNVAGKAIHERFSQEPSGLAILTRKEDRGDSASVLNRKVEDGRMITFETPSVSCATDRSKGLPLYKKFYDNTKEPDARLTDLGFEVELTRKKIFGFQIVADLICLRKSKPKDPEDFDAVNPKSKEIFPFDPKELFHSLKYEDDEDVFHAFHGGNSHEILVTHEPSNIVISRGVLQCLRPGAWLNDEVINLYLELLKERERREPKKYLKCHFFNTFFFEKLTNGRKGYDFKAVRRWTTKKKLGYNLIECDKVFVPIHKDKHWCLAVINIKDETFQYLDSLGGVDIHVLEVLARYLMEETRDKGDIEIDSTSWKKELVDGLPLQKNGWDCGMFMIKYTDFYSRGLKLCFSQEHMDYFRKKTAKEILRLRAE